MYSFIISIAALVVGYFLYGRLVEKVFNPDSSRKTPAYDKADGVDYVAMPTWKVYMIQFLNIAGTGPIFGAIMGAQFGPASFLWIVFGCIFAGAVHDYFSGMISVRNGGCTVPDMVGIYMGKGLRTSILVVSLVLLLLVGVVFVFSPALILGKIANVMADEQTSVMLWVFIIFMYYVLATFLPVDKVIGKIYPIFAFAILFMAAALLVCLVMKWPVIPEFWNGLADRPVADGVTPQPIFPCLFITISCGAISGFHSTQSPIMARCLNNEAKGRRVFYGAMIAEGVVALIWAAVSSYFFFDGGKEAVGATSSQAPVVVVSVAKSWLGIVGSILAIFGVVAAPITSGDTAFRSARIILADFLGVGQKSYRNRSLISIPIFIAAIFLLYFNIAKEDGFNLIWQYFGWANQVLSCLVLWTITHFLSLRRAKWSYLISLIPACFMTSVCVTFILTSKLGFNLPESLNPIIGALTFVVCLVVFVFPVRRRIAEKNQSVL